MNFNFAVKGLKNLFNALHITFIVIVFLARCALCNDMVMTCYCIWQNAVPLVEKLQYSDHLQKAIRYVFGRVLVCRNLENATELAHETRLECVTMDGNKV